MRSPTRRALALAALLATACRVESHPPAGVPADEAAIRSAVAAWLAKAEPWARVIRSNVRQEQDLASVWVITSPPTDEGEGERTTLVVLRREPGGWTVVFHEAPTRPRAMSAAGTR
jgi:hypothetical protein